MLKIYLDLYLLVLLLWNITHLTSALLLFRDVKTVNSNSSNLDAIILSWSVLVRIIRSESGPPSTSHWRF